MSPIEKVKPKAKSPTKIVNAISIKPSPLPEQDDDGNTVFKILYVTTDGKQKLAPCTKLIFQQIVSNRLCADHRNNFRLQIGRAHV